MFLLKIVVFFVTLKYVIDYAKEHQWTMVAFLTFESLMFIGGIGLNDADELTKLISQYIMALGMLAGVVALIVIMFNSRSVAKQQKTKATV